MCSRLLMQKSPAHSAGPRQGCVCTSSSHLLSHRQDSGHSEKEEKGNTNLSTRILV